MLRVGGGVALAGLTLLVVGCCPHAVGEGAGDASTGPSGSSGGLVCGPSNGQGDVVPAPGTQFCALIDDCDVELYYNCSQFICPACSVADAEILYGPALGPDGGLGDLPVILSGHCGGGSICDFAGFECLREEAPKVLSPSCAAAVAMVVGWNPLFDGGTACLEGGAITFCTAIGGCVPGRESCVAALCPACNALDGIALGGDGADFFGGLCPAPSSANPCVDLECLADAGPRILSPGCAAAVALLSERFEDGG
jgi:hypothetical protein